MLGDNKLNNSKKIYTFNTSDSVRYSVMKLGFNLSDKEVFHMISDAFELLQKQLSIKKIQYEKLKGALIPNQDKDKFETCLIIDSSQIENDNYGQYVFEKLLPLLDKESTYSILCGDYIDILHGKYESQLRLRQALNEVIYRCNRSRYQYSGQYYLIYFNRLTGNQRWMIVKELLEYPWFTGFADLSHNSLFKTYISNILCKFCIKCKNKIIISHPEDCSDDENVNIYGYPFEENKFSLVSINDNSFDSFLSYKIETEVPDTEDIGFSFNALFPKFNSFEKVRLSIKDEKWDKYLTDKEKGKGIILEKLGYKIEDKEKFIREIYKKICSNYLYNLTENQYGDLIFDVCVELQTINGHLRKTIVALKYLPDSGEMQIVTIT